jgi:hypothetical protein
MAAESYLEEISKKNRAIPTACKATAIMIIFVD